MWPVIIENDDGLAVRRLISAADLEAYKAAGYAVDYINGEWHLTKPARMKDAAE